MSWLSITASETSIRPAVRLARAALLLWALLVMIVPPLLVSMIAEGTLTAINFEPGLHSLMESFCGVVALLIAVMLLCWKRRDIESRTFGLAFLLMGTLDLWHAFANPIASPILFVALHTLSTLLGSMFILTGLLIRTARSDRIPIREITLGLMVLGLLLTVGYATEIHMSRWLLPNTNEVHHVFSSGDHFLHRLAGGLYGISAILVCLQYYRTREFLSLFVAAILLLFAETAVLFSFSAMWHFTWWLWHGAKIVLYLSVLMSVFLGLQFALDALGKFGLQLTQSNLDLRRAESQVLRTNMELQNRNDMVREAMTSFQLDHTMTVVSRAVHRLLHVERCEIVLDLPEDEVDEFERMVARLGIPFYIKGLAEGCGPFGRHGTDSDGFTVTSRPCLEETNSARLALSTAGSGIGHLKLIGIDASAQPNQMASVMSLTAEIGPIINNAMLYHRWRDSNDFQSALLAVSSLLTSTLNLGEVLYRVCSESARLIDSDEGLVLLTAEDGSSFTSVNSSFENTNAGGSKELAGWLQRRLVGDKTMSGPDGKYRPQRLLVGRDDMSVSAADCDGIRDWGALALFPLTEESCLIGVMVLLRKEPVAFSSTSLEKGELLAEQVRIAINNARTYRRLDESNRQLQVLEESRARAEQLTLLGQMAASIAHEVRNPLSAMTNCLAVLAGNCKFDDKGNAALEIIGDELKRLNKLTHDFLLFGKPGIAPSKPVMLEKIVDSVCANLERHLAQEALKITVMRGARTSFEPIIIDPVGLETVLWNLLLNASQAIEGSGLIRASIRQRNQHFLVMVSDTGRGIPLDQKQRIFDPFYSHRANGAGLGLAIVNRFITAWHGKIRIFSRQGLGTLFVVRIPMPSLSLLL
jgi:signal transduction histidine kinase